MRTRIKNIAVLCLFTVITFTAIQRTGNVNDVCMSEWKAPGGPAPVHQGKAAKEVSSKLDRISNLDLILPGVVFGL
jgi:hypothetical protein